MKDRNNFDVSLKNTILIFLKKILEYRFKKNNICNYNIDLKKKILNSFSKRNILNKDK